MRVFSFVLRGTLAASAAGVLGLAACAHGDVLGVGGASAGTGGSSGSAGGPGVGGGTGGSGSGTGGAGTCGGKVGPNVASCCTACKKKGLPTCPPNGCFGGYFCDPSSCKCGPPPSGC